MDEDWNDVRTKGWHTSLWPTLKEMDYADNDEKGKQTLNFFLISLKNASNPCGLYVDL